MNYITQAEYMSINQYADQMNNLVLSSRKIRFNTRKIITLNGFQNAFKDESLIIIVEQKHFKMTFKRQSVILRLLYGYHAF